MGTLQSSVESIVLQGSAIVLRGSTILILGIRLINLFISSNTTALQYSVEIYSITKAHNIDSKYSIN